MALLPLVPERTSPISEKIEIRLLIPTNEEDSYLSLRGRLLDVLRAEDVKVILKPTAEGCFSLKPRNMYLDESGKCKSLKSEPVAVTVKELCVSG